MIARFAHFLALNRNTGLLLVALLLAGTGERLWTGFVPKYLEVLGASVLVIGVYDALQTLLGALYAYPGGWMSDHWGQRRALMISTGVAIVGYTIVLLWQHWMAVLAGSFFFLAWSALSLPVTFAVVATSLASHRHTMGIGVQSLIRRVPMIIGPLVGGALIVRFGWVNGIRSALAICIGLSLVTALVQWLITEPGRAAPVAGSTSENLFIVVKRFTPALRELLVSDILIRFCERIPYAFVVLWAVNHAKVSAQEFGWLVTIEMVTAMLCYIPVAHLADKYGRRPFVLATFVFFTLFPLALCVATSFPLLAFAFAIRGLKEFGEPARKALIIGEASPEMRGRIYGAYYLIRDSVVAAGSLLGAWLWALGPRANFLAAAAFGAFGTLWFWWFIYRRPLISVDERGPYTKTRAG